MLFGDIGDDKIQLNEETVWAGEPGNNVPKDYYQDIQKIRALLFSGKYEEAQKLALEVFPKNTPIGTNYGVPYQTVGNLNLHFHNIENASNVITSYSIHYTKLYDTIISSYWSVFWKYFKC